MKRIQKLTKQMEKLTNSTEKSVVKLYKSILKQIFNLFNKLFKQYEIDGKLTMDSMSRYGRLQSLEKSIIVIIKDLYKEMQKLLFGHLGYVYTESYYTMGWAIESDSLAKLGYGAVGKEVIEESIKNNFTHMKLNERLEKNRNDVVLKLREVITQGLATGSSYSAMSKSVQKVLEGDVVKANRVVRTESGRVMEKAKLDSAKVADSKGVIMMKTWNSGRDERVRDKHRQLDNETILVKGVFKIGSDTAEAPRMFSRPENTINCRCFLTYSIKEINKNVQHDQLKDMSLGSWKEDRLK